MKLTALLLSNGGMLNAIGDRDTINAHILKSLDALYVDIECFAMSDQTSQVMRIWEPAKNIVITANETEIEGPQEDKQPSVPMTFAPTEMHLTLNDEQNPALG
jgi:hypothetical protein